MARMSEQELLALVNAEEKSSIGFHSGELSDQRRKSMEYYLAEPFGNEEEGQSQVISTDVSDTVEWMLPSLMRIFTSGSEVVIFEPVGIEDEQQAAQETDYVNHLFWKELDGFWNLYSWFKDALIQKNGIIKFWWDEIEDVKRENYQGLNDAELAELLSDDEVEAIEHTEGQGVVGSSVDPNTGEEFPIEGATHDVTIKRTNKEGRANIEVVPPDEFLISKDATKLTLDRVRFVAQRTEKTRSDLIEMGFPREKIEDLPSDSELDINTQERQARKHLTDDNEPNEMVDDSQRTIWVTEAYIRADFNDDGIAELRQVIKAGNEILSNEEVDRAPFAAITPVPLTHKFYGLSISDLVMDLQLIRSTILRQTLNNLYLSNNPEKLVNMDMVEMEGISDLLSSRVGGIKRVRTGPNPAAAAVSTLTVPFMGEASLAMLEYLEGVRRDRTGVGAEVQGLDPSVLQSSNASVVQNAFEAARMKLELIARILAETGVKELFRGLHELVQKHQQKEKVIQIRGRWVPVNPSEWKTRYNMTVTVGLGSGNREQNLLHLQAIWDKQLQLAQSGGMDKIVTLENIFNTATKIVQNAQLKEAQLFFTDPRTVQPQPQQPDIQQQALELQAQIEQGKRQAEAQRLEFQASKEKLDHERELIKLQIERGHLEAEQQKILNEQTIKHAELDMRTEDIANKKELAAQKERLEAASLQLERDIAEINAAIEIQKNELLAATQRAKMAAEQANMAAEFERNNLMPQFEAVLAKIQKLEDKDFKSEVMEVLKTLPKRERKVIRNEDGRVDRIVDV